MHGRVGQLPVRIEFVAEDRKGIRVTITVSSDRGAGGREEVRVPDLKVGKV
jgi:hypothetical protein